MIETIGELIRDFRSLSSPDEAAAAAKRLAGLAAGDSLLSRSRDLIATFPMIVSSSISDDVAGMLARAMEAEYASLLVTVISADDVVDVGARGTKADVLMRHHSNTQIGFRPSVRNALSGIGAMAFSGALAEAARAMGTDKVIMDKEKYEEDRKRTIKALRSPSKEDDAEEADRLEKETDKVGEAHKARLKEAIAEACRLLQVPFGFLDESPADPFGLQESKGNKATQKYKVANKKNGRDGGGNDPDDEDQDDRRKFEKKPKSTDNTFGGFKNQADKKVTEKAPTMVEVEVHYKADGVIKSATLLFGVKVVIHYVESSEMKYYVSEAATTRNPFFRGIQWTTGEIRFWKDLVFVVDSMKRDAVLSSREGSRSAAKWWARLRSLSATSRLRNFFLDRKILPNVTLVMSEEEQEDLKRESGVDLRSGKEASRLCQAYYLLRLIVANEAGEYASFFDEDSSTWERYSFKHLQGKGSGSKGEVKELISLLSK